MSRLLWSLAILLLVSRSAAATSAPTCGQVAAPTCGQVVLDLAPCLSYIQGGDATPGCCSGVKSMSALAKTKADLTAICNCGKQALANMKYDPNRIPPLPGKCGVQLTLPPIDSHTDCSKMTLEGMLHVPSS